MRILIATDAWRPQVNGVVRTLENMMRAARAQGATFDFLTPNLFPTFPLPTYAEIPVAIPNFREIARRIDAAGSDHVHIATEGPIGWATRAYCLERGCLFTSPNGHGGTLTALSESGVLDEIAGRGIRHVFYFQVDNPLVKIGDPPFLGKHLAVRSEASSKAILKAYAKEKINGVPRPAVFVLDQQGRVRWAKVETDYRERPSSEEVAAALDALE